ncbi:MAG: S1 RNA-binding domain-containing protein [Planctomycetes bacterium]|nr:S1 RNA-binding domain-containing protein [Planctomycetota bacterium]
MPMDQNDGLDEAALKSEMEAAFSKAPAPAEPRIDRTSDPDDPHLHRGVVTSINGTEVMVELGPKTHGAISLEEFETPPQPGESYEFSLVSIKDGLWTLSRREARALATWRDLRKGALVKAKVIGENSGGLELKIGPVSAFMPASEIALHRVDTFTAFVGETWECEVVEVAPKRKRVVLSRKAVLGRERTEARKEMVGTLREGAVVRGKIEKLEDFGAFVDLGKGVTGLLHVSNISHQRIQKPGDVLTVGQDVEVKILEVKNGGKRIGLGMKQLAADPFDQFKKTHARDTLCEGKVTRLAEFGAFVELVPGVEGLLHKSQVSPDRVANLAEVIKVGDTVKVRIKEYDGKKVSLSRLNSRGALIGSEEDVDQADMNQFLDKGPARSTGTNLGDVLRAALEKKPKG